MSDELMFSSHPSEDLLERFVMNKLAEEDLARVEEHLLLCTRCQESVEEIDCFIQATKKAAAHLPPVGKRTKSRWSALFASPIPVVAMALTALFLTLTTITWKGQNPPYQDVTLAASRGTAGGTAKAEVPLRLDLDATGLPEKPAMTIEMVNDVGTTIWDQRNVLPVDARLKVSVDQRFKAGQYFVRVYANALRMELLREYGLVLE